MGVTAEKTAPRVTSPVMLSPEGGYLQITSELFESIKDFVLNKRTGNVQINFRDGGFASVEGNYRKTYVKEKVNSR